MTNAVVRRATYDEYRAFERAAATKHELVGGEIVPRTAGTYAHSTVAAHVLGSLHAALRGSPCAPLTSDMRVRTGADVGAYPDASVACGERQFSDDVRDELLNPTVLVEVLSPSTEAYDRGEKFRLYETIESLREYVLVSTATRRVEVFSRRAEGGWVLQVFSKGQAAEIASIAVRLDVDALYEGLPI